MTVATLSARNPNIGGIGLSRDRVLDGSAARVPDGTIIVSADNHWGLAEDPWRDRVPARLKDRVPRIWWDEGVRMWNMAVGDGPPVYDAFRARSLRTVEDRLGTSLIEQRMADNDADGVAMEIVFPQIVPMFNRHPDLEAREWILRAYNEYIAEVGTRAPGRFFGVGFCTFWDMTKVEESLRRAKAIGLKTVMLPLSPGKFADGREIFYAADEMDVLWATAEELDLPIYFHAGENLPTGNPGGTVAAMLPIFMPFRRQFSDLVFGGILDRHPKLKIVFAESGINWVPGMLQDAEMIVDSTPGMMDPVIELRPSDYWHRNCWATMMTDRIGLELLRYVGSDRVMFAVDYPHNEGALGYTRSAIEDIVDAVSPDEARRMLGGTAIDVFDLPRPHHVEHNRRDDTVSEHDLVIRGGTIVDGTGAPAYEGDLAIDGDTISAVGVVPGTGRREIDAHGCIVTPGFIDAHTHLDAQIAWDPSLAPVSRHGVTTALLGNCGVTFAPCRPADRETLADMMENVEDIPKRAILEGMPWDWTSYGEYLDSLGAMEPAINVAGLVGHCAVRMFVMGERSVDEPARDEDIDRMAEVVAESLQGGALGFSTSRILVHKMPDGRCVPGTFATRDEVERISAAVGAQGGLMQFVPNYAAAESEMDLIAASARASGAAVLFSTGSHIATGRDAIVTDALAAMRSEGLDVTAMMIPRPGGRVTGLQCTPNLWRTPLWLKLGAMPFEERVAAIDDPDFSAALIAETKAAEPYGVLASTFWLGDDERPDYMAGPDRNLCAMADAAGEHPVETFLRLSRASGGRALFSVRTLNPDLDALEEMLVNPSILPGLGDAGAHVSIAMDGSWTTSVLAHWVRDKRLFALEEAVRQMTATPARLMGLADRGVLTPGARADVNVIDLAQLAEGMPVMANDFPFGAARFTQTAKGYKATICNGTTILVDDELTGARGGQILRKQTAEARA